MENMQFESLTIRRNPVYGYSIKMPKLIEPPVVTVVKVLKVVE